MRTALVIGASGNIGGAIHSSLEADGWKVIPTTHRTPIDCSSYYVSLAEEDYSSWAAGLLAQYGPPSGIVFAGGVNFPGPLRTRTSKTFDELMAVNARGPLLIMKSVWEALPNDASIAFIGSASAAVGGPITVDYAMSKAALWPLVVHLAAQGAPRGIRANLISPGWIEGAWVSTPPVSIPLGRLGTAKEVAEMVRYVMSAKYLTGQHLHLNGGVYGG